MAGSFYSSDLAYIHHVGFGNFSRRAGPGILAEIRAAKPKVRTIVDLGCGSGIWLNHASRAGYETIGVDVSPAMIRLAKRTSPSSRLACASLHGFTLPQCGAVTAIGEVLCYFPANKRRPQPLRPVFERVAEALVPGGVFIFDLITADPRRSMNNRVWRAGDDWAVLTEITDHGSIIKRNNTFFRKSGRSYRRSFEQHKAGVYSVSEVTRELRRAGFSVRVSRNYGKFRLPPRRTAFFAKKISAS